MALIFKSNQNMQTVSQKAITLVELPLYLFVTIMSHLGKDDIINLCSVSKTWHRRLAQKRNIWTNLIRMRYECDTPENCDAMKFYLKPFGNLYYTDILEKTFTSNFSGPMAKIRSVSVAACHSACLTINGDLYIWGKDRLNEYGADVKYIRSPRLIMSNVKDVKCVDIPGIFLAYTILFPQTFHQT